ncbi:MAG: NAD(P)-dependent oxidoreductase [Asgard group archaeon]|nr:NAD(P)-dependent oxidoreductase [Asgard group archaeon]
MRVLITGSSGFLGTNLIDVINTNNPKCEIFGIDHIESTNIERKNFALIDFYQDINYWLKLLNDIKPEIIYHLIGLYKKPNNELYNVNVNSFVNFIEAINQSDCDSHLLVIGSASQYGKIAPADNPISEHHSQKPINFYGLTKKIQEEISLFYNRVNGLKVTCVRPSNFIGKGISTNMLPGFLASEFLKNKSTIEITINAKKTKRDYIDVRDVCNALVILAETNISIGNSFNISSSNCISVQELIETFANISNKNVKINESMQKEEFDICLSNEKLQNNTNWRPKYQINDSIKWCLEKDNL